MNIKETYFENSKEITNSSSSSSSSSTSSISPLSASSPLNNSQSNQTPPYSTRSSYLGQNYLIDQKTHNNSQMLFNQQNYFDTNQYHHHLHQDLVNPTIDHSNHLYHHHHHQMPSIESSLLTFHNHSHHMSHHYYNSNLETANNSEFNQNTAKTNSPVSSSVSPNIKTELNECENSKKNQVNDGSHNDDTSSSTSSASSVHSNSASSTPFATTNHDSTLIPINDPSYHHYTRNYQNIDYNQQYNQANSNSTSTNNRLSVCLKYASTSDQIHMAAAAAAVAAAAVVSNTQSSLLSVPTSSVVSSGVPSSSSSSSISMEDYADGSSPQTHNFNHQMNSISQIHQNRLANPSSSAYSPNHLVGFYNNNLLENSSYYKNSASNLNLSTSSSTSSSSSSYQNQNVLESDYFAYQSYLNNQINESNEMAHTHGQSYPVNSSSPALIQSNHLNSQNAGLSQFNMDQSSILAQQQYLQSNSSANFNNLTNSSYNLTPNSTTSASSSTNLSSTNSRRCSPETTTSTTSTANTASSSTSYQNLKSSTNLQSFNTSYDNSQVQPTSNTNHQTSSSSSSSSSTSSSKYQKLNYLNNSHLRLPTSSNGLVQTHHHLGSTSIISQVPASQESIPPNQLCAVCGDNAACQHYGVRTCEGCKGFFKRTVQKNSKYVCLADKNCPVDKRRRNRCQYCRFQKCLAVGMVKEVVRTNDLKGRRGRLPTKPKSPTNSQANSRTQQSAFLSQIVRLFTDTVPNQTSLDFSKYRKITKEIIRIEEEPFWTLQSFTKSCDLIRQWTEKFSTLCRINNLDRDRLFFSNMLDLLVLRIALRMQDNIERIVLCNSIVFHKTQIAYVITSSILQQIQELGSKLKQPDHAISSILSGLLFLQDSSQQSPSQIEVYSKLKELLKEYQQQLQQQKQMNNNNNNNNSTNNLTDDSKIPNYYLQMNDIFIQVRQISIQLKQRLKQCNLYNSSVYPSCIPSNSILDLFLQSPDLNMPLTNHQQAPQQQSQQQQQQQQIGMQMNHQNSRLFHVQQQQQSIQQTNIRQDLQLNEFNS